jgi:hypothetical protein
VPGESLGSIPTAGAVNILYGTAAGLTGSGSQQFTQDSAGVPGTAEPDDSFGGALAAGDLDNDGFADLAVGAAGEDLGSINAAGAVNVLYGSSAGLTGSGSQQFTQDSAAIPGTAAPFDFFGGSLAAGDLDGDGFADLAVGVPREVVGTIQIAGAVNILYGAAAGLTGSGSQLFSQASPGVPDVAELGDRFGDRLATGDFDNDGFVDLAVGVPDEGVGSVVAAGAANVLYGSAAGLSGSGSQFFTQDSPGVPGVAEEVDIFGTELI